MNEGFKINDLVRSKLTNNEYLISGFSTGNIYISECIVFLIDILDNKEYAMLDKHINKYEFITKEEMMIE